MQIGQCFPSKFLKAADLENNEYTVTMQDVLMEDVGMEGKSQVKPVLYFKGTEKGLVLNKTNAEAIAIVYGEETDHWPGKKIILYPDVTMFNGQRMPCVRVRPVRKDGGELGGTHPASALGVGKMPLGPGDAAAQRAKAPLEEDLDDSIPF